MVVAVLALAGLTACGDEAGTRTLTVEQCRAEWAHLAQTRRENGNPGGPVSVLAERWNRLDKEAEDLARTAGAKDCGAGLDGFRAEWEGLESFQYALQDFDMAHALQLAEGDRRHYVDFRTEMGESTRLPDGVPQAFKQLRRLVRLAELDLARAFEGAEQVDVRDERERADFVASVAQAAGASEHVRQCRRLIDFIGQFELHEE